MAKPKAKKTSSFSFLKNNFLPLILSLMLFILLIFASQQILSNKFYPFTYAGDINISFLTKGQAIRVLQSTFQRRTQQKISFFYAQGSAAIDLATSSANLDYSNLSANFENSHNGTILENLQTQIVTVFKPQRLKPKVSILIDKQLSAIEKAVSKAPKNAQLVFAETPNQEGTASAVIQIKEAENGLSLDQNKTTESVNDFLLTGKYQQQLPLKVTFPKISTSQVMHAKKVLENTLANPVKLSFQNRTWTIDVKQLLTLLDLTKGDALLDKDQVQAYLSGIAADIDQPVVEGLFEFNPQTKRVTAFKPSQEGRKLNIDSSYQILTEALENSPSKTINLAVDVIKPKIATSDVNSLGIKELLGRGVSNFAGSIENRIYNINLAAGRINGVLIAPGDTFSFNQTVGDISESTGFKKAYVIKEGRTVLDDGGGVCQVSTTLFRAILNSGLLILKRTAHAYRVSYYEQGFPPGLDATVFYPSVDFQFKNDTQKHILIQAYTTGTTLYIDLYGTSDGRVATISTPVVTGQIPPPPELRQDDPTLPKGTVKQVDWAAWGATVTFKRTVARNGETLANETWKSVYKPWQAVYLVGTKE